MRQLGAVGLFCGICLACGGDGGGYSSPTAPPTPPPQPASIVGAYSAPDFWSATETRAGSPEVVSLGCAGTLTVAAQSAGDWTGTFTAAQCRVSSGSVSGTVDSGGNVVLRFEGETPFGSLDCDVLSSQVLGGPAVLRGAIVGGQLSLQGSDSGICGAPLASTEIDYRARGSLAAN